MATGILALLDDLAMLMDDAAMVAKVATKKTVGILGDDLAVNAEKASGFDTSREISILLRITKASFLNKLIILPIAFILSAYANFLIIPILILGGLYLAFEGAEKVHGFILHKILKKDNSDLELVLSEEEKIKSAILTDFILSIEIVVIALGAVIDSPLKLQIIAVSLVALLATLGVYGLVALLVKIDDLGFYFVKNSKKGKIKYRFGEFLIALLPKLVKLLGLIGTLAMFLVAGGIFSHNLEFIHHIYEDIFGFINPFILDLFSGFIIGYIVLLIVEPIMYRLKKK